jgi:hypothetical protein
MAKLYVEMIEQAEGPPTQLTDRRFTCCLCGSNWIGWGNNPDPLGDVDDDKCCDFCNQREVIPARLRQLRA